MAKEIKASAQPEMAADAVKNGRIDDAALEKVTGGGSPSDPLPPFPCPNCHESICITVEQALMCVYVTCPHCQLRIPLNP